MISVCVHSRRLLFVTGGTGVALLNHQHRRRRGLDLHLLRHASPRDLIPPEMLKAPRLGEPQKRVPDVKSVPGLTLFYGF